MMKHSAPLENNSPCSSTRVPHFRRVTSDNFFQGEQRHMDFDIRMNLSNGGIAAMAQQSDKICGDLHVKVVPSMETDCVELDDDVKKPAAAAATTLAADDERNCQEAVISATKSATTTQHDAILNSKISFPLNLTRMLESVESKGLSHIVHWSEDAKSFVICDIDLFLRDVLSLFFKSSEKTKIRSFYRKLNRWGFSMSRKNAYNPNNVWHHPEFNRSSVVRSLDQALQTGKATDFLNISNISRGKKRKGDASKELEHDFDDDDDISTTAMDGRDASGFLPPNLPRSVTASDNALSDLKPSFCGGASNATFDLVSSRTSGMMSSSYHSCAPSSNIFALSAQEMLAAYRTTSTSSIGHRLPVPSTNQNNISSLFATVTSHHRRRQLLQSEMTEEEDSELMTFFGNFAQTLPPPNKVDEDGCS
eukprot:CAMPEP_0202013358 /NCGR_PEP_ID=MMETSP0905-20130828/25926_1 /ASSEMBLY_ACC=CAM_ASM_000554 /TAXON_ID=420261 /ORGANISM="Thalassiosira antarctica, Strain CCMP982" /LENGTH=420 /DNA_ID=CAMNT_0048572881 /DNA_START=35 /DNA_END=1293 /DNA_ORIENTATION=+